jgi:multiple sugar transport system permease protein
MIKASVGNVDAPSPTAELGVRASSALERWSERHIRVLMIAPALILLGGLTLFPTVYMFRAAFLRVSPDPVAPSPFVGLSNFTRMFSDGQFQNSLKNTIVFTVTAVTIEFVLAMGFALLLDRYLRRFSFLKTIFMIPMMLPPIAVAITWKLIYQPQFGILNEIMYRLGLPQLSWAGDARLALPSIIVADIWEWTPFIFLLMLAGLASLPVEPYEAAEIDGASAWRQFWDLTLPFLKPVIAIALLLRVMDALRLFDLVFILTRGGPAGATETISLYLFKTAFTFTDVGYACALSISVLIVTVIFSTWFLNRMRLAD